jgi:hypothetical protein
MRFFRLISISLLICIAGAKLDFCNAMVIRESASGIGKLARLETECSAMLYFVLIDIVETSKNIEAPSSHQLWCDKLSYDAKSHNSVSARWQIEPYGVVFNESGSDSRFLTGSRCLYRLAGFVPFFSGMREHHPVAIVSNRGPVILDHHIQDNCEQTGVVLGWVRFNRFNAFREDPRALTIMQRFDGRAPGEPSEYCRCYSGDECSCPNPQRRFIMLVSAIVVGIIGTFWGLWRGQASFMS